MDFIYVPCTTLVGEDDAVEKPSPSMQGAYVLVGEINKE